MTLPDERYRAVKWAENFLKDLATDRKKYPRISRNVRYQALSILRHFPNDWDMKRAATAAPEVFQEKMEPVHRIILQYENDNKKD